MAAVAAPTGAKVWVAEPVSASSLLSDEELEITVDDMMNRDSGMKRKEDRLGTGLNSVDRVLDGGLRRGSVVGISRKLDVVRTAGSVDMSMSFLTTSLLTRPTSFAAVIDTTGNFDIPSLYSHILSRLHGNQGLVQSRQPANSSSPDLSVEDLAAEVLDRVKIMRVFDLVGMTEAVGEIRDSIERKVTEGGTDGGQGEQSKNRGNQDGVALKTTVPDSEDEEEDEEMLFESESRNPEPDQSANLLYHIPTDKSKTEEKQAAEQGGRIEFIVIDNVAQVLSPLLKKDHIQASAFATAFLRSLYNLTHAHSLVTLVLNPASTTRAHSPSKHLPPNHPDQSVLPQAQQQQSMAIPPPSIFLSNTAIPALGNVLNRYLDLHLLISQLPRRKADARAWASSERRVEGRTGMEGHGVRGPELVWVVEVLADRYEGREGDWASYAEARDGGIKDLM